VEAERGACGMKIERELDAEMCADGNLEITLRELQRNGLDIDVTGEFLLVQTDKFPVGARPKVRMVLEIEE
jgi:hypothetical protein